MHAVIFARRGKQDRGIALSRHGEMIGGIGLQKIPVLGIIRIAVFCDPARAREQLAVAAHVDQRDGAEQRAETLRIARQHVGDQDTAVRAALRGNPLGNRDAPLHKIGRDRGEIVMREFLAGPPACLVPARAEFAAAADIGGNAGAAALEP